jgi:hypothetical protein
MSCTSLATATSSTHVFCTKLITIMPITGSIPNRNVFLRLWDPNSQFPGCWNKESESPQKIHTPFFTQSDTNRGFATENELTQEIVGQTQKFTHQAHKKNYCSQKHKSIYVDLFIRGFVGDRCEDQTEIEEKKKKIPHDRNWRLPKALIPWKKI